MRNIILIMSHKLKINEINVKDKKDRTYIIYTLLFCIISLSISAIFIKLNKSFIWQADGVKQHYAILYHFNQIVRNLFQKGFSMIAWNMGLGLDVIGQYSYYVMGDPFAYLSLLFPLKHLEMAYNILVILRIYCVGLAFIAYCKYTKKEAINTIIGAIIYTFCGFILYAGIRHPYFTNAAILLPLNFIGIEKLLKENKKSFFIFIIFLSAISNYYFFYMITIMNVLYGCIKYLFEYNRGVKDFGKKLGTTILCYVIGILMASIILLPTVYTFLNSARTECEQAKEYLPIFYHYFWIGIVCMRFKNWTAIGVASAVILMLPILFTKLRSKEAKVYFSFFIITTIMLLFPITASMMNGFSFPNNRWVFAYSFILSYIVTICFDAKLQYTKKQKVVMLITLIFYGLIGCWITKCKIKENLDFYISIMIAFIIWLLIAYPYKSKKSKKHIIYLVTLLVMVNILIISFALYSPIGKGYVKEFIDYHSIENVYATINGKIKNYKQAIEYIKQNDDSFYRVAKNDCVYQNISLLYDYHPIELFFSLGNKSVFQLSSELEDRCYTATRCVNGADRRTKVTTLLGNKYYICDKEDSRYVPYGYELYHQIENTHIYINKNYLPVGIIYDTYITKEEFEKFSPLEKEDALITTAMIKENVNNVKREENIEERVEKPIVLNYQIKDNKIKNNSINITKKNEEINLILKTIPSNTEVYLSIKNLKYKSETKNTDFQVTTVFDGIKSSEQVQDCISSAYYMKNKDFLINLGISKEGQSNKLKIKFNNKGIYSFDELKILAVSMEQYIDKINKLERMTNTEYGNDFISGEIEANQSGILQIATSYSKGWKVYVDDEEVKLLKVNEALIGCEVEKGKHQVRFQYETPYLKLGIFESIIGVLAYIVEVIIERRMIKNK